MVRNGMAVEADVLAPLRSEVSPRSPRCLCALATYALALWTHKVSRPTQWHTMKNKSLCGTAIQKHGLTNLFLDLSVPSFTNLSSQILVLNVTANENKGSRKFKKLPLFYFLASFPLLHAKNSLACIKNNNKTLLSKMIRHSKETLHSLKDTRNPIQC